MQARIGGCSRLIPYSTSKVKAQTKVISRITSFRAFTMSSTSPLLKLAPISTPSQSSLFPFPGFTPDSAETVRKLLEDNHKTYHCFFNDSGFHNHLAHHLLASLSIGSPPTFFQDIWRKEHSDLSPDFHLNQKPASPPSIDESSWFKNLNNPSRYWPLLSFFDEEISKLGIPNALEKFVFSQVGQENDMPARLVSGAVHPLIHVGYGAEFKISGVVAEGLAMACVTKPAFSPLFPSGWHDKVGPDSTAAKSTSTSIVDSISKRLSNLASSGNHEPASKSNTFSASNPRAGLSIFSLTTLMSLDPSLAPGTAVQASSENKTLDALKGETGQKIEEYCQRWITTSEDLLDPDPRSSENPNGWWNKLEELVWFNTLLLGSTSKPGKAYKHDFFLMHCNNSLLFLPTLLPLLSEKSRSMLLHAHLRCSLLFWIARGRPLFHIDEVLLKSTEVPSPKVKQEKEFIEINRRLYGGDNEDSTSIGSFKSNNPWYGLMELLQHHNDEHLVKAIRTLSFWNTRFSSARAGTFSLQEEALNALSGKVVEVAKKNPEGGKGSSGLNDFALYKGLENLDGTAFIRTCGQLMESQGWKGDGANHWSFDAPGFDETWE